MVLENPFPPDIRVEKEMRALATQGHEVTLLCAHKGDQPAEDTFGKAQIIRFQHQAFGNKITKRLHILYHWLTGRKRAWEVAIEQFVKQHQIQALHVHDLPLVPAGLAAARKSRIPLIFDMHEIYPIMIRDRIAASANGVRTRIHTGLHNALFSPRWWDRVEQRAVEQADRIIVVVEESKQRLQRMRISGDKIAVVLNAEDIDSFVGLAGQAEVPSKYKDDFLVGYVGGVDSPIRGLDNLVQAWPMVLHRIPNARLLIVGDGGIRLAIEELVRDLDLTERVTFAGWVSFNDVASYIKALHVAVIPHTVNEHTNHTIPHKLFQYLALGKLVVSSDIAPIRRILEHTQAGIIVPEYSPRGFADAIVEAQQLLQSGKHDPAKQLEALRQDYGFEALAEPLLNLYQELNG